MRRFAVVVALLAVTPARADDKPWAAGVTTAQKDEANKLLEEGNALFLAKRYPEALDRYRKAIASWDHPAIRFNIVRCLIQLDRPVEAFDNLELALKYGAAPLEEAVYAEALSYQKLLVKQVGTVAVTCSQAGVAIMLDGKPLPACPMHGEHRVAPGRHQLVGTREGLAPRTEDIVVVGGDKVQVAMELAPLHVATTYRHRWATWKPWVVFGAGLATVAVGGVFEARAFGHMRDYDNLVAAQCPGGCAPDALPPTTRRDQAQRENAIGVAAITGGGALAVLGSLMLYVNRERAYPSELAVQPLPGGAALSFTRGF